MFVLISYNLNMCLLNENPLCIPLLVSFIVLPTYMRFSKRRHRKVLMIVASREKTCDSTCASNIFKGQLGVHLTVYPGYLLCSSGILGDCNP